MATAKVTRSFKITGIQAADGAAPAGVAPVNRITVSAMPVDANGAGQPQIPGMPSFQWPFDDPDGSIAAFFVVNSVVELSFTKPGAAAGA